MKWKRTRYTARVNKERSVNFENGITVFGEKIEGKSIIKWPLPWQFLFTLSREPLEMPEYGRFIV